jgi:ATP-dependent DNA helicase RecQ
MTDEIAKLARERFGLKKLRPGQAEAVHAVLDGHDTLAVMSTGYGKSAIYQLAALMIPGPTLVISPLISLQRDQVEALEEELPGEASALDSSVSERQREERLEELADDQLEFLFLAPEQLAREETVEALREAKPSLLVVDEAHSISEWGHDFRPEYLHLGRVAEELGHPTILALTATAAPPVRDEIVERLHMRDPKVIVRGFDRPNIHLAVEHHREEKHKREALIERALELEGAGIVYVATRRLADELAEQLRERGAAAAAYHAGLTRKHRDEVQESFMEDELRVVVATTAFGMGVDKPNIRFVLHHDPSDSVDSYYQEIGRAGRDGEPARAILFYRPEDIGIRRFFAAGGQVDGETLERVATLVRVAGHAVDPTELQEEAHTSASKLASAITRLEDVGAVHVLADGRVEPEPMLEDELEQAVELAEREEEQRGSFDRSRVEMMRGYAEHEHCRRAFILSYFGEPHDGECGNCDNDDAGHGSPPAGERPFELGSRVTHRDWGNGVVQRYDGDEMFVLFDSVGYKTLSVPLVEERGLLETADG